MAHGFALVAPRIIMDTCTFVRSRSFWVRPLMRDAMYIEPLTCYKYSHIIKAMIHDVCVKSKKDWDGSYCMINKAELAACRMYA